MTPTAGNKVVAAFAAVFFWVVAMTACVMLGCFDSTKKEKPKQNQALTKQVDELHSKLKDPRVSQCFQSAFALGKAYRQQGRMKPTHDELHLLGLGACEHYKVPPDMRGVAVDKFKNGFGWGWSAGP